MNYDIHIYWSNDQEKSEVLALKELLTYLGVQTYPLVNVPVGPHPLPMFESHVTSEQLPTIESALLTNRRDCSILIHEKTNDHMYDHTTGARWLGKPLALNLEYF